MTQRDEYRVELIELIRDCRDKYGRKVVAEWIGKSPATLDSLLWKATHDTGLSMDAMDRYIKAIKKCLSNLPQVE